MKAMHERRPRLSLFPEGPKGATMFARYIAYHRLSGNSTLAVTKEQLFNNPCGRGIDIFGANLQKVCEVLPHKTSRDLLPMMETSTMFGVYSAVLAKVRKAAWQAELLAGCSSKSNAFLPGLPGRKFVKSNMHFCSECIVEDHSAFGMAFWRVVHQFPGVHHCPQHGVALRGACSTCGKSQASDADWLPPDHACPHCGGTLFEQRQSFISPAAYQPYLKLCEKVAHGQDVGLAPENRIQIYSSLMRDSDSD